MKNVSDTTNGSRMEFLEQIVRDNDYVECNHKETWQNVRVLVGDLIEQTVVDRYVAKLSDVVSPSIVVSLQEKERSVKAYIEEIKQLLLRFDNSPPFTIVRIAQLLSRREEDINTCVKFLRALERSVRVDTTVAECNALTGKQKENTTSNGDPQFGMTEIEWLKVSPKKPSENQMDAERGKIKRRKSEEMLE